MIQRHVQRHGMTLAAVAAATLAACGGGGGGGSTTSTTSSAPATSTASTSTYLDGTAAYGAPLAQAKVTITDVNGKTVTVKYGAPSMRGRKVMGELVPYGQVWRTGANNATSFVTDGNLKIGTTTVPAGNYTLYTLPSASQWMLIINKQTGQWVNHTEWHRIVAFGKPADYAKGLKKGDYVEIEGELRSTEYDAQVGDGKKKTTVKRRGWEVRASIVRKLAQPESSREENLDAEPITEDDAA